MFELSEKHGVNPSFIMCAWCLRPKKFELFGKLPGDIMAPAEIIEDYDPCDNCKKIWAQGVAIIEVSDEKAATNQPAIIGKMYPTGNVIMLNEAAFNRGSPYVKGTVHLADEEAFKYLYEKFKKEQ